MSNHCCGGKDSKEPLGWEGWLTVVAGVGWVVFKMVTEETELKTFGIIGQTVCGIVVGSMILRQLFWPRPKETCDHHDHHDQAHE